MKNKFLRIIVLELTLILFPPSVSAQENIGAWASSNLGKCYSTIDEFMLGNFWEGYADDENIIKKYIDGISGGKKYMWAIDTTPKINSTSILVSIEKSGKSCIILYSPLSSSISFNPQKNGNLPKEAISEDTPPPGFKKTRITYKLNNNGIYIPNTCQRIDSNNNKKNINCKEAFINEN